MITSSYWCEGSIKTKSKLSSVCRVVAFKDVVLIGFIYFLTGCILFKNCSYNQFWSFTNSDWKKREDALVCSMEPCQVSTQSNLIFLFELIIFP